MILCYHRLIFLVTSAVYHLAKKCLPVSCDIQSLPFIPFCLIPSEITPIGKCYSSVTLLVSFHHFWMALTRTGVRLLWLLKFQKLFINSLTWSWTAISNPQVVHAFFAQKLSREEHEQHILGHKTRLQGGGNCGPLQY